MKLTATFIVVAFGSMLASAAEAAVISSATSSVTSSSTSTGTAASNIVVPTPPAPTQAASTRPVDTTKITVPMPKPPVANPNHIIRPPHHNYWFGPGYKPYRPAPRPYGYPTYPPKPYFGGAQHQYGAPSNQGVLRQKRSGLWPGCRIDGRTGSFVCPGSNNSNRRLPIYKPMAKRSPLQMICFEVGGCGGSGKNWGAWHRPIRAQKRAPIIRLPPPGPICYGLNCGSTIRPGLPIRRPITWPFRTRVNARSAEAEAALDALW